MTDEYYLLDPGHKVPEILRVNRGYTYNEKPDSEITRAQALNDFLKTIKIMN